VDAVDDDEGEVPVVDSLLEVFDQAHPVVFLHLGLVLVLQRLKMIKINRYSLPEL
jgi:hypothetical protein